MFPGAKNKDLITADGSYYLGLQDFDELSLLLQHERVVLLNVSLGELVQLDLLLQLGNASERLVL